MGNRMDGAGTAQAMDNVTHFPALLSETPEEELTFWQRRALDLQITSMAPPLTKQTPYWNTTMVTAWVAVLVGIFTILGAIGALYLYTDSVAEQRGIEKGRQAAQQEQMQRTIDAQAAELRQIKEVQRLLVEGEK